MIHPAALTLALIAAASAKPATPAEIRTAAERALVLLDKAATGHAEQKTCFACHNQAFPVRAFAAAGTRGLTVRKGLVREQAEHVHDFLDSNIEAFKAGKGTGGQADTAGYALFTLQYAGHEPDEATAAVVGYLLKRDADKGYWRNVSDRPPTEASPFTTTALGVMALKAWGRPEQEVAIEKRIAAARAWLTKTPAKDTEDRVFRLLALGAAEADHDLRRAVIKELVVGQRPDGGWGQTDAMPSDPYATATVLVALHEYGGLERESAVNVRGVAYLLRAQRPDGSWFVKSRSKPFQPYYESGFPHGKNQFISASASGWAATALILALPPARTGAALKP
jgi:hypothetical protein